MLNREQYYIDLLKPEYNILRKAGSSLGNKHSPATIAKLRSYKLTSEQLAKLKEHFLKHNARDEQRVKARARMLLINENKGTNIEVFDTFTDLTTTYSSIRQAALAIGCSNSTIAKKVSVNKGIEVLVKKKIQNKSNRKSLSSLV